MTSLARNVAEIMSATDLAKNTRSILGEFENGEKERCVLQRRGKPVAVIMSVQHLEEMLEEIQVLRAANAGGERLASIGQNRVINEADVQQLLAL